eukprot:4058498-Prymnesium_polylepis.1
MGALHNMRARAASSPEIRVLQKKAALARKNDHCCGMVVALLSSNALAALGAALDPHRAPVTVLDCGPQQLRVRVPEDDAVMEAMVAAAHATALAAGEDEYDD